MIRFTSLLRRPGVLAVAIALLLPTLAGAQDSATERKLLDEVVAVVNEGVILRSELTSRMNQIRRRLSTGEGRMPPEDVLRKQVLDRLIVEKIQMQRAERTGIRVSDDELAQAMQNIAERNNASLEELRRQLEREGIAFEAFREQIRRQIIMDRLRRRDVAQRISVTKREVDSFLEKHSSGTRSNAEYHLRHILLSLPQDASPEEIGEVRQRAEKLVEQARGGTDFQDLALRHSDGQHALDGGDLGWRKSSQLPTMFAGPVDDMNVGGISDPIRSPSGFHIIKLVDQRGGDQRIVTQEARLRHILMETNELTSDRDARARLNELRRRVAQGADFARLAREHSDDSNTAASGGNLGWVRPSSLPPTYRKTVSDLRPGEVSKPFQTSRGWHIVQVLDRRERDTTEEARRNRARQAIFQRKMREETELWLRRLRDEAYVDVRLQS